jgi:hypothetical protein
MTENEMRLKDLRLALTASATHDVRHYLNGVNVVSNYLVASDGHRLVKVTFDTPITLPGACSERSRGEDVTNIMIPREAIKAFLAKCVKVPAVPPNLPVEIKAGLYPNQYILECAGICEFFTPIDCARYPSFDKLLTLISVGPVIKPTYVMQFEWSYISDIYNGLSVWAGIKKPASLAVEFKIIEDGLGFGYFSYENALAIIMSKRM